MPALRFGFGGKCAKRRALPRTILYSPGSHWRSASMRCARLQLFPAARRDLGHGLIMAQPKVSCRQLEHGEEVGGVLFVARGKAPEVFDPVEEPLSAVAR